MGFFSSRRHDIDVISTSPGPQSQSSSPSPGIISSRFVRVNASFFLSLRSHTSLVIYMHSMGQYGRNKNKARDANPTPPREVATPLAVSKKQPSLNDAPRTPNGYQLMNDSAKKRTSESSLHSPNQQQAPKSPGPASSRASTDAITHVCSSQTRMNLPLIFFSQGHACTAVGRTGLG